MAILLDHITSRTGSKRRLRRDLKTGGPKVRWIEPIAGTLLMALVLADVFLTVLYARAGTGIISDRLARLVWLTLRRVASDRTNSHLLSFCGPFIVVALL